MLAERRGQIDSARCYIADFRALDCMLGYGLSIMHILEEGLLKQNDSARTGIAQVARVPMLIGGDWRFGQSEYDVIDPYRGEIVARAPESTPEDLDAAISAAVVAKAEAAAMPGYKRAELLHKAGAL